MFKTKEKPVEQKYNDVITAIHKDFNEASDKNYTEAEVFLGAIHDQLQELEIKDNNRQLNLKELGFTSLPVVIKEAKRKENLHSNRDEGYRIEKGMSQIRQRRKKYPNNKFITEEQVMTICKKYKLVFGDVSFFTGFVPEQNQKEIEEFVLHFTDKGGQKVRMWSRYDHALTKVEKIVSAESLQNVIMKHSFNDLMDGKEIYSFHIYSDDNNAVNLKLIEDGAMKIAAPLKDMKIPDGHELKGGVGGWKIIRKIIPAPPDPVVLMPVDGGYLIVTAWGDEAEDPIIKD